MLLAQGYTIAEAASECGVSERTVWRWKKNIEFAVELDRLSLMVDISGRAHRLRLAMRVIRKLGERTEKDLLDWLRYAQSETDGVKLDLTALLENAVALAGGGSAGSEAEDGTE